MTLTPTADPPGYQFPFSFIPYFSLQTCQDYRVQGTRSLTPVTSSLGVASGITGGDGIRQYLIKRYIHT